MELKEKIIAHAEYLQNSYEYLNFEIVEYLKEDIPKKEKLDRYYSYYLPAIFKKLNDIFTFTALIEKDFKDDVRASKFNSLTLQFKIDTLDSFENLLKGVLKIDYDRALFEYLDVTNKLDTTLKIKGEKINDFFRIFYDRLAHIERYPKPDPLELSGSLIKNNELNFKNKFDNVPENRLIEYFTKNLIEKRYLSEEVLKDYLKQAFELKKTPQQKFSFEKLNTQNDIINIFYNYYKIVAGKPYGRQNEYFNLLKNYFNGFENINIRNFSK